MSHSPTTFYSASAGSGKTYTLARDYLTLLFKSHFHNHYRKILAITFTNKAVAEMKERILEHLYAFTQLPIGEKSKNIFQHIIIETGLSEPQMIEKATVIHQRLLHDYSAFDIVTIDAFNHRVLRTFAKDINIPPGFEVEMDTDALIHKAVYNLIAQAGTNKELTKILIDYSLYKIEDNKSWDITYDLLQISELIKNENHYHYLKLLKDKTTEDFKKLQINIKEKNNGLISHLTNLAQNLIFQANMLSVQSSDFTGGATRSPFNVVIKTAQKDFSTTPDKSSLQKLIEGNLYAQKQSQVIKDSIDALADDLKTFAIAYKEVYGHIKFHENVIKSLVPLSLLNAIMNEIELIKQEEQIVPIYEFNGILSREIKNQPAPFIYERLGEKYRHYFIDEFQDTSTMQWENLKPLISNALQSEDDYGNTGSLMLVGDAKQSIYRWRGGDANQFLGILDKEHLFNLKKENETLKYNWRSYDEIIKFNNDFFNFYGDYLHHEKYRKLYHEHLHQEVTTKKGGYIQLDFLEPLDTESTTDPDIKTPYPQHVLQLINEIISHEYQLADICILVRKHTQGHELAQFLVKNNIQVVSGDSLLIKASLRVQLLVAYLRLVNQPHQEEFKFNFLSLYAQQHKLNINDLMATYLKSPVSFISQNLLKSNTDDVDYAFAKAQLLQSIEATAQALCLLDQQDVRLESFLEFVFEFMNKRDVSLSQFLDYWDEKKDKKSIPAAQDSNAVKIMTIHKAKGLEFPVVIVPYCDTKLNDSRNATDWAAVNPSAYEGFEHLYINLKQEVQFYPDSIARVYHEHQHKTQMDHINELYVAFTRAEECLYICGLNTPESKTQNETTLTYSQLLKRFVNREHLEPHVQESFTSYSKGKMIAKTDDTSVKTENTVELGTHITSSSDNIAFSTRRGIQWATGTDEAILRGTILHDYMAQIISINDLDQVVEKINRDYNIALSEREELVKRIQLIVSPQHFGNYFSQDNHVLNERGILTPSGKRFIPDRLIINNNTVTIIDYKTGVEEKKHQLQLDQYAVLLSEMGYHVKEKVLLYTDTLQEVVWN